jgi:hypothetical protein
MTRLNTLLLAITGVFALRANVRGQVGPLDCPTAVSTLTSGSLAAADSQNLALLKASSCGTDGVNALAAAWRRRSTQTSNYGNFFAGVSVADTALMNAALDIATDGAASAGPRSAALAVLYGYVTNRPVSNFNAYAELSDGDVCGGGADPWPATGWYGYNNLPANALATVRSRVGSLERDALQPAVVRVGANCVMNAWRTSQQLPTEPVMTTNAPLQLEYVCQTRFRVKNSVPFAVKGQYRIGGNGTLITFAVQPAPAAGSTGYAVFDTHAPNTPVSLFFDGQPVNTAYPTTTACP